MYPLLKIDINKLEYNLDFIKNRLNEKNIKITGVLKGCASLEGIVDLFAKKDLHSLASSRMKQIEKMKKRHNNLKTMLIRIPMLDEIESVIKYADISLNSELITLKALEKEAENKGVMHEVITMFDLGDLREGCFDEEEFFDISLYVENSKHLKLLGTGTNLSCYGSILPTKENINRLVEVTEKLEEKIKRKVELISAGATSSLPLFESGKMNERVNHLRLGESILNNKDLPEYFNLDYKLYDDIFKVEAQIVEIKEKPSHPIGQMVIDAFGRRPVYIDKGIQRRGILAMGRQDIADYDKLIPVDKNIEIIGASSDHLIIDLTNAKGYEIGSIVDFEMYYPPMLYLSNSDLVTKKYIY